MPLKRILFDVFRKTIRSDYASWYFRIKFVFTLFMSGALWYVYSRFRPSGSSDRTLLDLQTVTVGACRNLPEIVEHECGSMVDEYICPQKTI